MESKIVDKISNTVYGKFPEVAGVKPKVRKQSLPDSDIQNYLLTFNKNVKGPKGQSIPRFVRVVASPNGKIIKITTSK
jgi:hypothetical protein